MNRPKIAQFADRLVKLADDYRDDVASVVEEIKAADLDVPAVRRLAAWSRRDPVKRAEQEAIDEQYRFLAGETETPAILPAEGMLAEAARLYADKLSVRQVAGVLKVSVGRAQKLRTLAGLFTVHVHDAVNTTHDPETGEITKAVPDTPPSGDAGTTDKPYGPGSIAATYSNAAGRNPGDEGEENGPLQESGGDRLGAGRGSDAAQHRNGIVDGDDRGQPTPAEQHAGPDRGSPGTVCAAAQADQHRQGADEPGAEPRHAGGPALHRQLNGREPEPAGCDLHQAGRNPVAIEDATPRGCVDDDLGLASPQTVVPLAATSQADGGPAPTATPAPMAGIGPAPLPDFLRRTRHEGRAG